jgi:hypothetical protein
MMYIEIVLGITIYDSSLKRSYFVCVNHHVLRESYLNVSYTHENSKFIKKTTFT